MPNAPSCDTTTNTCITGASQCTGDDANDDGDTDDGPSVATTLPTPTAPEAPTIVTGAICSEPATEEDWYRIDLTRDVSISLAWLDWHTGLEVTLYDESGEVAASVNGGGRCSSSSCSITIESRRLQPGTYFILVRQSAPATTRTTPYTLTITDVPECFGDDVGEPDDDDMAGAQPLGTDPITAAACWRPSQDELDFYRFDVTAGQGKTITVTGPAVLTPLALNVVDAMGRDYGYGQSAGSELVARLTNLPAGTYYVRVQNLWPHGPVTAVPYTIIGTTEAVVPCTENQCTAERTTQLYRGVCTPSTNECSFIPDDDTVPLGGSCDSDSDCAGTNVCSHVRGQTNAQNSICVPMSCAGDAACDDAGAAAAPPQTLHCRTMSPRFCMPTCTVASDCGGDGNFLYICDSGTCTNQP